MTSITIREKDNKTVLEARVKVSEKDSQNFRKLAVTHYQNDPIGNLYGKESSRPSFVGENPEERTILTPIYQKRKYNLFLHTSQGIVSANITFFTGKLVAEIKGNKSFVDDFHRFLENIS